MCHDKSTLNHLIRSVQSLLKDNAQRWAIVENKSGNLEVVPESSLPNLKEEIIYKLKN